MNKLRKQQRGFTIIELMIATTIFSLVLMICLAAIMTITRMYYQGTLQARTQNRVREIVDEVADEIRYQPGEIVATADSPTSPTRLTSAVENADGTPGSVNPVEPFNYDGQHCVGTIRYRYVLGFKTTTDAQVANVTTDDRNAVGTLVRETLPGACNEVLADDEVGPELIENTAVESMLDENMRLLEFEIASTGIAQDSYRIAATIAYGDDDLIGFENGRHICRPDNVARAYCAVSRLEVIVTRRF